jgi:hypothetical protein
VKSLVTLDLSSGGICGIANSVVVSERKVYPAGSFGKNADEDGVLTVFWIKKIGYCFT